MSNESKILKDVAEIKKENTLEKHIQTILLSVITALIIAGVFAVFSMNEKIVRMEERDKMKTEKMDAMQTGMNRLTMDMQDMKDRMTRIESNQNANK